MNQYEKNDKISVVKEQEPFMITFSSQEEAELYRIRKNLQRTDMERFAMLCKMMRIGKMLSSAKKV